MAAPSSEKEGKKTLGGGGGGGGGRRAESLGWLTESAVMPKKHKLIEGVGAASILDLKAQLYRSQQDHHRSSDPTSSAAAHARKRRPADPFSLKNSGVQARAHKDKLEMKAVRDGSVSYAALEKKAALYEKLARGELPDEEESEKYCVDFFQKTMESDRSQPSDSQHNDGVHAVGIPLRNGDADGEGGTDDGNDPFFSSKPFGLGRTGITMDSDQHKRFVREVHEEVNQAREKTSTLKMRRQEQEAARREKLRQAYLKKQLDKLLSSKQQDAATETGSSAG